MNEEKSDRIGHISELPPEVFERTARPAKYKKLHVLELDDFVEVHDYDLWLKMRGAAHSYGQRSGKKFKAKWCNWRKERAEAREERGLTAAGMDTQPKGFIWRVK